MARRKWPDRVDDCIESFLRECVSKVTVLPITPEIAARALSFPESYPKDPQGRLIGATALVEGAGVVSQDRGIAQSGSVPVARYYFGCGSHDRRYTNGLHIN